MHDVRYAVEFWFGSVGVFSALIGGMAGATFRAIASETQETWSIKTASDIVIGGLVPAALPFVPGFTLLGWAATPPGIMLLLGLGMGLTATWVVTWVQWVRRMGGQEPAVKNAAAPIYPAAGRGEGS